MGDFNLPEINWEHHTAGTTQARRFLKNLDDNFMEHILRGPTRKDAPLDLLLDNGADLVSKVEIGGCLGHSDHEENEFKIFVDRRNASEISTLNMRREDFSLLRELITKGIATTYVEDLELGSVESHEIPVDLLLKFVQVHLDGIPSLSHVSYTSKVGIVSTLAENALYPTVYVIDEDIKLYWSQYGPLRETTFHWCPSGH
ncbi:hypothetical protein BTVI_59468 [Pitangus sulphuratus]|nr:hypothetical protein BTVI_59468 [Pitangus sulphuratus]